MNNLKCPFCQQELNQDNPQSIECRNDDCKKSYFMYGSKELWQELTRTRKALDVAVDALKNVFDYAKIVSSELQKNHLSQFQTPISKMQYSAQQALKQITTLEQKDVK